MSEIHYARKLVIDRRYYELPQLTAGTYIRTSGGDGVVLHDPKCNKFYPYAGASLTDHEVRFYLTYFNQIDVPCIPEIDYAEAETEFLESTGFLVRSTYPLHDDGGYCWPVDEFLPDFGYAPDWALRDRSRAEPGLWSLALRGRQYHTDDIVLNGALELELYDCLPVPMENTPFADILEFKLRYAGELDRFRLDVRQLYERVVQSRDSAATLHASKATIRAGLSDLQKALRGRGIGVKLVSLKTQFSIEDLGKMGTTAGALVAAGVPFEFAIAGGIAVGILRVDLTAKPRGLPDESRPIDFAYIAELSSAFRLRTEE